MPLSAEQAVDTVYEAYKDRCIAILVSARDAIREAGIEAGEPFDMSGDDYQWVLPVNETDDDNTRIDVSLEIAEARSYGDDPEDGINFGINIVRWGGEILGGLTPYNYTPECWVSANDPDAVEARFEIIESADVREIAALIAEAT